MTLNTFTQQDIKGTYTSASVQQLRSLADHGHADAHELLALGLSDKQLNLSHPTPLKPFSIIKRLFWAYTERLYQRWNEYGPHNGL